MYILWIDMDRMVPVVLPGDSTAVGRQVWSRSLQTLVATAVAAVLFGRLGHLSPDKEFSQFQ